MKKLLATLSMFSALGAAPLVAPPVVEAAGLTGAIFTTESACDGTNVNVFPDQESVFLDGGPVHTGAAGLPDGEYYVQVTEPSGALLGTSIGSGDDTPVVVVGGEFAVCYQLVAILVKASDATAGYDVTSNGGGEYKIWVSTASTFPGGQTKTDNFKVETEDVEVVEEISEICVAKFYDANANGIDDDGIPIDGWLVDVTGGQYADIPETFTTPECREVFPGTYTATEVLPPGTWVATTQDPQEATVADGESHTFVFGNLCLGAGGGKTIGFWGNKNGASAASAIGTATWTTALNGLFLVDAAGNPKSFANHAALKSWLQSANAVNMSYMLSAQLAAMQLNVLAGFVSPTALVYAPGCGNTGVNLDWITIEDLIAAADAALALDGSTPAGDEPHRTEQACLKDALDAANNNTSFVQPEPCAFAYD